MHLSIAGRSLMGPFPFAQKDLRQLRHFIVCCLLLGHLPGDALSPLEFSSDVVATRTFWHPYETALASRDPNAITLFFQPSPHMLWRASYTTPFSKLVRCAQEPLCCFLCSLADRATALPSRLPAQLPKARGRSWTSIAIQSQRLQLPLTPVHCLLGPVRLTVNHRMLRCLRSRPRLPPALLVQPQLVRSWEAL
jgi:hypothetical protein